MNSSASDGSGLRLELQVDASLALDKVLIGRLRLSADHDTTVSARLNLIEGDLVVEVIGPAGHTARCAWPWPVDAMPRRTELRRGRHIDATVALLATDTSAPLFPQPGAYTLVAHYDAAPGITVSSPAVTMRRTAAPSSPIASGDGSDTAELLRRRDVIQSLLSASAMGDADTALQTLAESNHVATRTLAALALDQIDNVVASLADADAGDDVAADVVAAVDAVLPQGCFDDDERRVAIQHAAGVRAGRGGGSRAT